MNIVQLRQYCNENFEMEQWGQRLEDERKRPQITTFQVFESLFEMPALGQKTMLEFDEYSRTPEALKWHGSPRRQVASDSSLERIVAGMKRKPVQDLGYDIADKADLRELWDLKLPSGRKLRYAAIDGHWAGEVWVSVLAVAGKTDGVIDLEKYPGRGHELEASRKVLRRAFKKLGKGYFGIVGGDGLYANKHDFKLCQELGSHLLVKTDEKGLTVIEDAMGLFNSRNALSRPGVGFQKGFDSLRNMDYEVVWAEGFEWQGLTMTVAWVKEHHLKPEKDRPADVEFWILTTATEFTGEDLRELGHRRWEIENNIFKRLNHLVGSKRRWSRKPQVMEMLLRIWMIGLTLLGAYLLEKGWNGFQKTWKAMKKTWRGVTRLMKRSLIQLCT